MNDLNLKLIFYYIWLKKFLLEILPSLGLILGSGEIAVLIPQISKNSPVTIASDC